MPKVSDDKPDPLAEQAAFKAGFHRSANSNLWRDYEGMRIIIVTRKDGRFGWMIVTSHD